MQMDETISMIPVDTAENIRTLGALAKEIWNEHFVPIIGQEQVDYMVDKFQSPRAMAQQIADEGYHYYFICRGEEICGYTALRPEAGRLFISKLYVRRSARGQGLARYAVDFACKLCREKGGNSRYLTVNRHNDVTIAIYRKMGFYKIREQVTDIGGGFVMDDFVMQMDLA